jgi:hypothetical protein
MIGLTASDVCPWNDFDFSLQYYGFLLSLTASLVIANIAFFTVTYGEEAIGVRVKLAACRAAGAFGGLGIGAACGKYALVRIADLLLSSAH